MQSLLFILLFVLLILELTKWKVARVIPLFGIIFTSVGTVFQHQMDVRLCHMDEEATVEMIAELGTNDCQRVVQAAQSYLRDFRGATYENPFSFGFSRYVKEQKEQKDFQTCP